MRQKYGITEGNPTFKYNTRKILMILDEDMNDTLTELGKFIFSYGPTKNSLWISYNSFYHGALPKGGAWGRVVGRVRGVGGGEGRLKKKRKATKPAQNGNYYFEPLQPT